MKNFTNEIEFSNVRRVRKWDSEEGGARHLLRADNFVANPGSGGSSFASDDIGGVHFPRLKLIFGPDGTNSGDVSATNPLPVSQAALATGGTSIFRSIDLDETEEEVKATAGTLYGVWFSNMATSTRFLKIYDATAANVTVGTTTPLITIAMPGNTSDDISGSLNAGGIGINFGTAITMAATTGIADSDTGAPGANEVIVNAFFK